MSNFTTLQSRVSGRLIDTPSFVSGEVATLINEAISLLQNVHNFRVMQAEKTYTTTAATHILGQIPSRWKEPRGFPYYLTQLGTKRTLTWQPNREMAYRTGAPTDANTKGPPRDLLLGEPVNDTVSDPGNPDYLMSQLNIEVFPYPDGLSDWTTSPAGEYRVHVPYWAFLPALSGGSDTNWFTENATQFIVCMATALGFQLDWDNPRAAFWMSMAIGPKGDWNELQSIGGWARSAINLDRSLGYAPGKVLAVRRDVLAPRDQGRA